MSNNSLSINENLDIEKNLNVLIPTGTIILKAGKTYTTSESNLSEGVCPCDGRALSRRLYSSLFSVIGTQYGVGDGSTTFNVPTVVNFPSMPQTANLLGTTVGTANHTHAANASASGTSSNVSFDHAHYLGFTTGGGASHGDTFGGQYVNVSGPNGAAQLKRDGTQTLAAINHIHAMSFATVGLSAGGDHAHYLTATHGTSSGDAHSHNFTTSSDTAVAASSIPLYTACLALIKL